MENDTKKTDESGKKVGRSRNQNKQLRSSFLRNRVALALVTFHRPHVLLLDEVTNHLDMGTVESLVESLCEF